METPDRKTQTPNGWSSSPLPAPKPPVSSSVTRLWRPSVQRHVRNQWSKLASCRQQWVSSSSAGRSHATSLVNAYLSQKYMPAMELGVLSDMPNIRKKASSKLFKQQEFHRSKLLLSYKDMAAIVTQMFQYSRSMRCYLKGSSSSALVQFSSTPENNHDTGDGGGIAVFSFWSISSFEQLAEELVLMFATELILKRLLVAELVSLSCGDEQEQLCWSSELYEGEFDDLSTCNLFSKETCEPAPPKVIGGKSDVPAQILKTQLNQETLQIYLTTWLAEVNLDNNRVDEIFTIVGEEMHVKLA